MSLITNKDIMQNITIINADEQSEQKYEDHGKIPKITYVIEPTGAKFEEAKRVIAIVYRYDSNNNVKYGASIFRKVSKTDICIKSQIRETAFDRFNTNPVYFTLSNILDIDNKLKYDNIIKQIRYKIYEYGVKGREIISDSLESIQNNDISMSVSETITHNTIENEPNYLQPRISYILEPKNSTWQYAKRIIAIVYSYSDNEIIFGACIFRRDYIGEACVKANIRSTALERFYKYPIYLEKYTNNNKKNTVVTVLDTIRKQMHKLGVKTN